MHQLQNDAARCGIPTERWLSAGMASFSQSLMAAIWRFGLLAGDMFSEALLKTSGPRRAIPSDHKDAEAKTEQILDTMKRQPLFNTALRSGLDVGERAHRTELVNQKRESIKANEHGRCLL